MEPTTPVTCVARERPKTDPWFGSAKRCEQVATAVWKNQGYVNGQRVVTPGWEAALCDHHADQMGFTHSAGTYFIAREL